MGEGEAVVTVLEGLVVSDQSGFFDVEVAGGQIVTCRLRGRLLEAARSSDIAAVGDRVKISILPDETGAIEEVQPRTSALSRAVRTEGRRGEGQPDREQVIVANADQALFVFAAAHPPPNFKMLDRFLVAGEKSGIAQLMIVVNKIDLDDMAAIRERFAPYEKIGYRLLYTSAREKTGIDELRDVLRGHLSVFTGPSGVGKTSLLNVIQPGLGRAVKDVSKRRAEGIHTTRDSALVKLEIGGYLADTPGLKTLTLWDIEPEELDGYFREIAPLVSACKFNDCAHFDEPGCAVAEAAERGDIAESRYLSYLSLRMELEDAYAIS
ncbi:MAG: ribosome small subunit-dependent GTPase A [Chloroflexi bacterium]|nr:ribosome small subunit-dependent GTPase A [Chloroflexota bacterium]